MQNKGSCKYCGRTIDESIIRCSYCDLAWHEGFAEGWKEHKFRIKESLKTLINLIREDEDE